MEQEKIVWIVFLIVVIILFVSIYIWENKEMKLVETCKSISDVPDVQKVEHLQNLACFNYTKKVNWRMTVLSSIVATFLISLFLYKKLKLDITLVLVIAFIILASFSVIDTFNNYHYQRVICYKANPQSIFFENFPYIPKDNELFQKNEVDNKIQPQEKVNHRR